MVDHTNLRAKARIPDAFSTSFTCQIANAPLLYSSLPGLTRQSIGRRRLLMGHVDHRVSARQTVRLRLTGRAGPVMTIKYCALSGRCGPVMTKER
jgi:hypothetical protein